LLEPIIACADLIVDTSDTNIYQLRELIRARMHETPREAMSLLFESFGFKNGTPPTPISYSTCAACPIRTGSRIATADGPRSAGDRFLQHQPEVMAMVADLSRFLETWLPRFELSDRSYLTVAIGCTGGQHRSVFIAEALARIISVAFVIMSWCAIGN
jgi:UPF0042 nucleotide-binding protein